MAITVPVARGESHASLADVAAELRPSYATIQDWVIASLRQAIVDGVLRPGTRLRQDDLATSFNTSRIPIREALRLLEYEGFLDSKPHRGFVVKRMTPDEVEEIYELRILLEGYALRLALPLLTEDDMAVLETLFAQMEAATDPEDRVKHREELYLRLYSVIGRPRLLGLIARFRKEVGRSLVWFRIRHSTPHHRAFFEAVRASDAEAACAELEKHYRRVSALLRRFLREEADDYRTDAMAAHLANHEYVP